MFVDLQHAMNHDYAIVFPVAAVLILLILALLLRSAVAPWYLMGAVGLGFAATLGATVLIFQHLQGDSGLIFILPVRDALRVLEGEGLVVNPPARSASVAPLDLEEFHAIYRVRRLLEPDLARRSVSQLEEAELDRLYQAAAEFGGAERSMDDIYDDHRAFHLALLAPAASAWDIRILMMSERASERYVRIGFGLLDPDPSEHDRRRDAHQLLVDEFRKRAPQVAARALDEHLAHNEELAHNALSGSVAP